MALDPNIGAAWVEQDIRDKRLALGEAHEAREALKNASQMERLFASINNGGVQHSNRFEVRVWPPASTPGLEEITLRCDSVTMPGRTLNSISDANIFGPTREIVDGTTYAEDVTCTFLADGKFDVRRFFETWQELAFSPSTWEVNYHKFYVSKFYVFPYIFYNDILFLLRFSFAKLLGVSVSSIGLGGLLSPIPLVSKIVGNCFSSMGKPSGIGNFSSGKGNFSVVSISGGVVSPVNRVDITE